MAEREFFSGEGANQGRPINIYQELIDECAYRAIWRYSPTTMHDVLSAISEDIREEGDSASQEDTFNVVWAFRVIAVSRIDWRHTLLDLPEYNRDEVKHTLPYVYHQFRQQQNLWGETGDELSLNHFQAQ